MHGEDTLKINNKRYQLKCIVEHLGDTITSGHYVCNIMHDGKWINCNDLAIKPTKLSMHITNGYIMMYTMVDECSG